jgi:SEC-C motif-containing protein
MACHCGKESSYAKCCQPLIEGDTAADTAEALMRSRYSAFCVKAYDYIVQTTDPQARLEMDEASTKAWMNDSVFSQLEILRAEENGNKGTVEFKATFKTGDGPEQVHHELSKFRKQAGVWYFRDGKVVAAAPAAKS